ncbi:MAG: hypothetical protein ACREAK_07005 [Nitrosarchaeum sp.]
MVNYLEGAELCETNSDRLQTSARIILNDSNGTDSFALFLYYIAYEEIVKGILSYFSDSATCFRVSNGMFAFR